MLQSLPSQPCESRPLTAALEAARLPTSRCASQPRTLAAVFELAYASAWRSARAAPATEGLALAQGRGPGSCASFAGDGPGRKRGGRKHKRSSRTRERRERGSERRERGSGRGPPRSPSAVASRPPRRPSPPPVEGSSSSSGSSSGPVVACPSCGEAGKARHRFCSVCGQPLQPGRGQGASASAAGAI